MKKKWHRMSTSKEGGFSNPPRKIGGQECLPVFYGDGTVNPLSGGTDVTVSLQERFGIERVVRGRNDEWRQWVDKFLAQVARDLENFTRYQPEGISLTSCERNESPAAEEKTTHKSITGGERSIGWEHNVNLLNKVKDPAVHPYYLRATAQLPFRARLLPSHTGPFQSVR